MAAGDKKTNKESNSSNGSKVNENVAVKGNSTGNKKPVTYEEISAAAKKQGKIRQESQGFYKWEEEEQTCVGRLLKIVKVESEDGKSEYNRYTIDTDNGLQGVSAGVTVDKIIDGGDYINKIIVLTYKGKTSLEGGRSANNFELYIIEE